MNLRKALLTLLLAVTGLTFGGAAAIEAAAQAAPSSIAKSIGVIKAINGDTITLASSSGPEVTVTVQPNARILRLAPGEKDLKNATPLQLQDLHVGDTIRARGQGSDDAKSIAALEIIVITQSAVAAMGDQIRQDWQKRGIGGLVSAVDPSSGTVTISVMGFGGKKNIAVHTTKNTVVRRYAPDSVKFEDAKSSTLSEIQSGDQLRARGDRSADGSEFAAEEIVSGSFRNIAGTVNSVDASAGTVTVHDVLSKKTIQVKVTSDSQLHQLPAEMAQRIAVRVKAAMAGSLPPGTPGAGASTTAPGGAAGNAPNASGAAPGAPPGGGAGNGMRAGSANLQQMLERMPALPLADLHKGDAVMMVATEGSSASPSIAITLLSGVEPILQAAPNATQAMMLTPWSLGAPGGDAGSQ